ncbi:MAG: alkaline phosphatase family protein [Planctomycetota bacterium]
MSKRLAQRVLVIGWDAADWRVIDPLLEQGKMPALQQLIDNGVRGNLATIQPALSPMLWSSIATGKRADKHGIHGFVEPKPDGSGVRPVSSTSRHGKAVWNIAHQNNLKSMIVSWYASHPAEPIDGAVVSERFFASTEDQIEHAVSPAGMQEELSQFRVAASEITAQDLVAFVPKLAETTNEDSKRLHDLAKILAHCASVQAISTHLMLKTQDWDLAALFFDGLDHLGHCFMPYHPPHRPGVQEREYELFKDVVTGGYRFFDMMLEAILAHAGKDTTVVLVSDHGFKSDALRPEGDGWEKPVDWHRQMGIAVASGPGIESGGTLYGASVLDVTPTVLHLLGLSVGRDMDGRPWLEIMDPPTPAKQLDSWDEVEGDAGLHREELREDPESALAMMQQLVELGYVAPLSEDNETTIKQTLRDNRINFILSLFGSNRVETARPIVEELLEEYPDDALILSVASRLALAERNVDEIRRHAQRSEAIDGRNTTVLVLLVEAAMIEEDYELAVSLLHEIIDSFAGGVTIPAIYCRLGDALSLQARFDEAEKSYREILDIDADHAPGWLGLAKIALQRDNAEEAIDHASHAASLIHVFPEAHLRLGEALAAAGRNEDAVTALEVCASQAPRMPKCIALLAKLKRQLGHEDAELFESRAKAISLINRGY